jgi:hypothetical protein
MSDKAVISDISYIRAHLKTNGRFRLELMAAVSKICRDHGVEVTDDTLSGITLARSEELNSTLSVPILPGGINCAKA